MLKLSMLGLINIKKAPYFVHSTIKKRSNIISFPTNDEHKLVFSPLFPKTKRTRINETSETSLIKKIFPAHFKNDPR